MPLDLANNIASAGLGFMQGRRLAMQDKNTQDEHKARMDEMNQRAQMMQEQLKRMQDDDNYKQMMKDHESALRPLLLSGDASGIQAWSNKYYPDYNVQISRGDDGSYTVKDASGATQNFKTPDDLAHISAVMASPLAWVQQKMKAELEAKKAETEAAGKRKIIYDNNNYAWQYDPVSQSVKPLLFNGQRIRGPAKDGKGKDGGAGPYNTVRSILDRTFGIQTDSYGNPITDLSPDKVRDYNQALAVASDAINNGADPFVAAKQAYDRVARKYSDQQITSDVNAQVDKEAKSRKGYFGKGFDGMTEAQWRKARTDALMAKNGLTVGPQTQVPQMPAAPPMASPAQAQTPTTMPVPAPAPAPTAQTNQAPYPEGTHLHGPDGKLYIVKNGVPVPAQ